MIPGGDSALQQAAQFDQQLRAFMGSLKQMESGGNYQIFGPQTKYGRASGAYQFIDSTWGGYGGYTRAADAPPAVQDQRARELITQYFTGPARGDWGAVAVAWHAGPGKIPEYFDGTLNSRDVNMSTRNYVNKVVGGMHNYPGIDASVVPLPMDMSGTGSVDDANADVQDAWELARRMLDDYGLSELFPEIEGYLLKGLSAETAVGRIRDTTAFKDRFPGLQGRVDNNYNAISPYDYLRYEDNIKNLMAEAGFPPGFYDEPEDLADFISNDVTPEEISDRIGLAQRAVMDADPLVKEELQERFGIGLDTEADLVAYFLDPERAVPLLELGQQVKVSELSAATQRAMGIGQTLSAPVGEELARRGYSTREIGERLKGRGGMTQQMLGERKKIKASEVAAAEFGLDSEAVANIRRLRQNRQMMGARVGGAMMTQGGVTGFGSANT